MKIFITGITGTIGSRLSERLLEKGHDVVGLTHSEKTFVEFKSKHPNIRLVLGDITDKKALADGMNEVDGVYHLAAQKSIDVSEIYVEYCCITNILGTINLLEESYRVKPKFVLLTSSDKARQLSGVYGCSKYIGERLFEEAERTNPYTRYRVSVFGNVIYSTNSVLCKWKDNILNGKPIKVTNPNMTRFFWSADQAVDHMFDTLEQNSSKPYVPNMKAISIGNLVEAMMQKYGRVPIEIIGDRKGESLHESLGDGIMSNEVKQYTIEEMMEII